MGDAVERIPAQELMWDTARIQRSPTGQEAGFVGGGTLSPTALLPAVWYVQNHRACQPYFWHIFFSTDTALRWSLYTSGDNPGLAALGTFQPVAGGGGGTYQVTGGITAAPAIYIPLGGGYAAAGSYFDILKGKWLVLETQRSLALVTSAVAANCWATFWWCEH